MDKVIYVAVGLALVIAAFGEINEPAVDNRTTTGAVVAPARNQPSAFTQSKVGQGSSSTPAPMSQGAGVLPVNPIPPASELSGRVISDRFQSDPAGST